MKDLPALSGEIDLNNECRVSYAGTTDNGTCRLHNEDCFGVLPEHFLFCVADGVGGMDAGEIASRTAVQSMMRGRASFCNGLLSLFGKLMGLGESKTSLTKQIEMAGQDVSRLADELNKKMATTMVALRFLPDDGIVEVGNIGDSRAYLFRGKILGQISHDHSVAYELLQSDLPVRQLDPSVVNPHRITKALGGPDTLVKPDIFSISFQDGDCFLLCTDGLTDMVSDAGIAKTLARCQAESLPAIVGELIEKANGAGGRDNITVVVIRVVEQRKESVSVTGQE